MSYCLLKVEQSRQKLGFIDSYSIVNLEKIRYFNVLFNIFIILIFFPDLKVKADDDLIKKEQLTVTPTSSAEESA